ncbi:hypothetical protein [Nostoc sp.]|uniref:hypothetical protein n=1 Tax=Nostoc sp. TaxID=1180 RepID=UPI002FFB764F
MHLALAIRNRGYTNVLLWRTRRVGRLRGLTQIKAFQPAEAGFVCVAATSSRLVQDMSRGDRLINFLV